MRSTNREEDHRFKAGSAVCSPFCSACCGRSWQRRAALDLFTLFGVLFMLLAVSNAIYHFRNAKKKNRDSLYDITDSTFEEREGTHDAFVPTPEAHYCPYCGTPLVDGARYCQNCGQKIR